MVFKDIKKVLLANGWTVVRINGSHYQFANINNPGYVVTVPHHGKKDISRVVLKNIEKGTGLSLLG